MASRKCINIYIPKCFMAIRNCINIFVPLRVRGTSLLICAYIGKLRNEGKLKGENEPFIVLTLMHNKVLS